MTGSSTNHPPAPDSALGRFLSGANYGLARTYWTLYWIGAVIFFLIGSVLVAERNWVPYVILLVVTIAYSFVLLIGVQRFYRGSDPGKALARIAMLFLLLNLTNMLLTFSFI